MRLSYELKIDAYSHIVPPKYKDVLARVAPGEYSKKTAPNPALWNLDKRFRIMDHYQELVQVITLGFPPIEDIADKTKAIDLSKKVNDEMAELVYKYPERFIAGVAHLPMNNMPAAMKELERAILDLRLRGIQIYSPVNDKPLDNPEFMPLYEKMSEYDLPIYIHPMRPATYPDYRTEKESKHALFSMFGWPYETTTCMSRLVFSGVMEKYPKLKVITHHCGGMVPYFADRIQEFCDLREMRDREPKSIIQAPLDGFKQFYADTALYGNPLALTLGHSFFGPDHILFAVDMPLGDSQLGYKNYRQTLNAIELMPISKEDRRKILHDNAKKVLRLPV